MERLFTSLDDSSITNFCCVRFGNIAWSTGSVFPIWKKMFKKNKTFLTTGPYMRRFFFTIDDAVDFDGWDGNNPSNQVSYMEDIVENADQNSYDKVYRKMYENIDWFGDTQEKQNRALLAIRVGLVNHAVVVDPEINLAATMVELEVIRNK